MSRTSNNNENQDLNNQDSTKVDPTKNCNICNKPVVDEAPSLTQWIYSHRVCQCDKNSNANVSPNLNLKTNIQEQQSLTNLILATICRDCGERIVEKKAGSITQWIFQSHNCSCDNPNPVRIESAPTSEKNNPDNFSIPNYVIQLDQEEIGQNWLKELDRYSPIKILGTGASGTVYLCFDRTLQKLVAIKNLNNYAADQILSFQNEARATSRLNHDSIVKVIDFGITKKGSPYLVMEYIDGVNLANHIEENSNLSIENTLTIARKLSDALAHVHSYGIFHRDIKSTNIIITYD